MGIILLEGRHFKASCCFEKENKATALDRPFLCSARKNRNAWFYSIRKLLEAKKLTIDVIKTKLSVISFPSLGEAVTLLNWHHFDRLYDFNRPNEQKRSLQWLCNIIVHSYIFSPVFGEQSRFEGLFFNSDLIRHEALYFVHIEGIISLFKSVGNDNANYAEKYSLDSKKGDFEVVLRNTPEND